MYLPAQLAGEKGATQPLFTGQVVDVKFQAAGREGCHVGRQAGQRHRLTQRRIPAAGVAVVAEAGTSASGKVHCASRPLWVKGAAWHGTTSGQHKPPGAADAPRVVLNRLHSCIAQEGIGGLLGVECTVAHNGILRHAQPKVDLGGEGEAEGEGVLKVRPRARVGSTKAKGSNKIKQGSR